MILVAVVMAITSSSSPNRAKNDKILIRKTNQTAPQPTPSCVHSCIDLSLVLLLSSKDFDRSTGFHHHDSSIGSSTTASLSSSEISEDGSSDSRACQVNDEFIENEKNYNSLASSRPMAFVGYRSIELDMSGSLLNSIYKIGGSGNGRSKGLMFGRRFSLNDKSKNINIDRTVVMATSKPVASNRSSEVEAVIASLKNISNAKRKSSLNWALK